MANGRWGGRLNASGGELLAEDLVEGEGTVEIRVLMVEDRGRDTVC